MTTREVLKKTKNASFSLYALTEKDKNALLLSMADALENDVKSILCANKTDLENARGKISEVMLDRLMLNETRIGDMAKGIRDVLSLPDPVGRVLENRTLENGLELKKVSVPMGVVGIIYESRPNVTSDAAALCIKSGNACVLRPGKEAYGTAKAIVDALKKGIKARGFDEDVVSLVPDPSRESANEMMKAVGLIDLLIPRGGKNLIKSCVENALVPCIETGTGICHVYIDKDADLSKALKIVENAKTSRPSVCNAAEVLLVHCDAAERFLPVLDEKLGEKVTFYCDETSIKYMKNGVKADETSFDTEFLDLKMAVGVVSDVKEAVKHIAAHSTHHSESIVTENGQTAEIFTSTVDSAAVYVNASTRFTDGGVFGLGCEMGISTQKLHARGPMGLNELTSYKYILKGNGQIR